MIPRQHLRALFSDLLSAGCARATLLKRGDVPRVVGWVCEIILAEEGR